MKLLMFDTSQEFCTLALVVGDAQWVVDRYLPRQQAQQLLPLISELLMEGECPLHELNGLVVGAGPGSFTGVRIAVAMAQGLGFSLDLPILRLSSLQIMAQTAWQQLQYPRVLVAIDARMEEVYWGAYEVDSGTMMPVLPDRLSRPGEVAVPDQKDWLILGNAWQTYEQQFMLSDAVEVP